MSTKTKYIILTTVIGTILSVSVFTYFERFSSFIVSMILVDMYALKLLLIDKYLLEGFDLIEELKNGNVAVGLVILAFSIIIVGSLLAAFVVFA